MARERERKFELKNPDVLTQGNTTEFIRQAYLMLEKGKQLRIRLVNDARAFICYKSDISDIDRDEFEYQIPFKDGKQMYESSRYQVEKVRTYMHVSDTIVVVIDTYFHGLRVVEIEYENELPQIPYFCGPEVTGIKKYSNIVIAKEALSLSNCPIVDK